MLKGINQIIREVPNSFNRLLLEMLLQRQHEIDFVASRIYALPYFNLPQHRDNSNFTFCLMKFEKEHTIADVHNITVQQGYHATLIDLINTFSNFTQTSSNPNIWVLGTYFTPHPSESNIPLYPFISFKLGENCGFHLDLRPLPPIFIQDLDVILFKKRV